MLTLSHVHTDFLAAINETRTLTKLVVPFISHVWLKKLAPIFKSNVASSTLKVRGPSPIDAEKGPRCAARVARCVTSSVWECVTVVRACVACVCVCACVCVTAYLSASMCVNESALGACFRESRVIARRRCKCRKEVTEKTQASTQLTLQQDGEGIYPDVQLAGGTREERGDVRYGEVCGRRKIIRRTMPPWLSVSAVMRTLVDRDCGSMSSRSERCGHD